MSPATKKTYRVGFMGPPGSGKSTVSQALQVEMGSIDLLTAVCPEEARIFISKFGQPEHIALQSSFAFKQMRREDTLAESCDVLFCDSPVFLCGVYATLMMDKTSAQQRKICRDVMKWAVIDQLARYDYIIYLPRQFEVVDDGVRQPEYTSMIEKTIEGFLNLYHTQFPDYIEVWSDKSDPQDILRDRVTKIKAYLTSSLNL